MSSLARVLTLALLMLALLAPASARAAKRKPKPASGPVDYALSLPDPTRQYVHVRMTVAEAPQASTAIAMPAWTPGSYLIRDFGKHVYEVEAHELGGRERALAVERTDKQTWTIANHKRGFVVDYRVFADDLSVRTSYLDDRFALLNGTSVFMYVVGETSRPATLELAAPPRWSVHTGLDAAASGEDGVASFTAASYDELADSPLLLGETELRRFRVAGADIELAFAAPAGSNADLDRIARDAEAIVRAFARIFNGLPLDRYVFLLVGDRVGGGGLEHHDSTAMIVQPFGFTDDAAYQGARRLIAHEFFHLWNVKRIHDRVLGPFDYAHESYSNLLWFHEGFTETMEARALLRAGLLSPEQYLDGLAHAWNEYLARPGRNHTPIAELSREAWIKAYQPEANHAATTISYYDKGNLIGSCLDLELRLRARARNREGSLEGLFRRLWAGRDPITGEAAITLDDIVAAASEEAGEDMRWFFDRYVLGTEELPLPELLDKAGFALASERLGERPGPAGEWTGMRGRASVDAIEPGSPAEAALMLGDEPVAVAGTRVRSIDEANSRIAEAEGEVVFSVFRRDRLVEVTIAAKPNPHVLWSFELPDPRVDVDLELARIREQWLLGHLR
ncbi:M61 family metallopeptidase [Nannocystaceae bacterium ST9]